MTATGTFLSAVVSEGEPPASQQSHHQKECTQLLRGTKTGLHELTKSTQCRYPRSVLGRAHTTRIYHEQQIDLLKLWVNLYINFEIKPLFFLFVFNGIITLIPEVIEGRT